MSLTSSLIVARPYINQISGRKTLDEVERSLACSLVCYEIKKNEWCVLVMYIENASRPTKINHCKTKTKLKEKWFITFHYPHLQNYEALK